jgi:glutamate-ammonia-ligase adenylyltransferase
MLRLSIDGVFRPADAPRGLTDLLLSIGDSPDLSHLEALLAETQKRTREIFTKVVGPVSGANSASGELSEPAPRA